LIDRNVHSKQNAKVVGADLASADIGLDESRHDWVSSKNAEIPASGDRPTEAFDGLMPPHTVKMTAGNDQAASVFPRWV
jgi:hypothetical protein